MRNAFNFHAPVEQKQQLHEGWVNITPRGRSNEHKLSLTTIIIWPNSKLTRVEDIEGYQLSPALISSCALYQLSSTLANFRQVLSTVINSYHLSSTLITCRQLLSILINYCQLVINSHQLLSTPINSRQLWSTFINSYQFSSSLIINPHQRLSTLTNSYQLSSTLINLYQLKSTRIYSHQVLPTPICGEASNST